MTQAALTLGLTTATALVGVLLAVLKIVVGHIDGMNGFNGFADLTEGTEMTDLTEITADVDYSLWKVSLKRVRFMMERPKVNSSVYSISLPTLTPRARMVILTSG